MKTDSGRSLLSLLIASAVVALIPAAGQTARRSVARAKTPATSAAPAQTAPGRSSTTDPRIPPASDPQPYASSVSRSPQAIPNLTNEEKERWLKAAEIEETKQLSEGTTHSYKVKMSDGGLLHDAHIQIIDVYKPVFRGTEGTVEKNFKDSWKFNVAAYRLAKMIGLADMVPPSIERVYLGKPASYTWWVDDVWMDEAARRDKKIKPPTADFWIDQLNKIRVFDALIYNVDRNQGNLLITHDWHIWMIDHTRSFRSSPKLFREDTLSRCDKTLLERLKKLDRGAVQLALGSYLTPEEMAGLLARRDVIVRFFESEIKDKGEDAVLTGMPRSTPRVTIP